MREYPAPSAAPTSRTPCRTARIDAAASRIARASELSRSRRAASRCIPTAAIL